MIKLYKKLKEIVPNKRDKIYLIFKIIIIIGLAIYVNFHLFPSPRTPSNSLELVSINNESYRSLGYFDLNQEDRNSGDIGHVLWKVFYLGSGRDKICFEKTNLTDNEIFSASYNNGNFFNVTGEKCFAIPKNEDKITFDLTYTFTFSPPSKSSLLLNRVVNKSECIWITGNNTCITQEGIQNAKTEIFYFDGDVYLKANLWHEIMKFVIVIILSAIFVMGFLKILSDLKIWLISNRNR